MRVPFVCRLDGPARVSILAVSSFIISFSPPATAATLTVCATGCAYSDFQQALNDSQPGDTILLRAGETFTGNFVLPAKSGSNTTPILIRSDAPDSALPAAGIRLVPPGYAGSNVALNRLARLKGRGGAYRTTPVLKTAKAAHNYRLQFLDIDGVAQDGWGTIVEWGNNSDAQTTLDVVPYGIVLDRVYVHGHAMKGQKRCIALNGASLDVLNSFVTACAAVEIDAQAIAGFNGPGPFKISNNYLEGSTENILFGGADPKIPNLVPSDIQITRNFFTKPVSWRNPVLVPPSAPAVTAIAGGGSLSAARHYFNVVAVMKTEGDEAVSARSAEASVLVGTSGSKVTLTWSAVPGADFYRVYRGTTAGGENRYMQSAPGTASIVYTATGETAGTPPTQGKRWNVKNLLELKNARRVLVDGNVFEHSWAASQKGYAILLTPRNQGGNAPWSVVRDVTLSNNVIRQVAGGIDILGTDYEYPSQRTTSILIRNNLVYDVSSTWGSEHFLLMTGAPLGVTVDHNTIHQEKLIVLADGDPIPSFVLTNNIAPHNQYGIFGSGAGFGNNALAAYFPNATIRCASADLDHFLAGPAEEEFVSVIFRALRAAERLAPVLDRIETWDSDQTLMPGVDVRLAPGHTPGSSVVVLSDGSEQAMLLGDIVHCPLELMDDDFNLLADHDQELANKVREAYARELERGDIPAAAAHFPGLQFGRLLPSEGTRRWSFGS